MCVVMIIAAAISPMSFIDIIAHQKRQQREKVRGSIAPLLFWGVGRIRRQNALRLEFGGCRHNAPRLEGHAKFFGFDGCGVKLAYRIAALRQFHKFHAGSPFLSICKTESHPRWHYDAVTEDAMRGALQNGILNLGRGGEVHVSHPHGQDSITVQ